jgi:hypothetical protein
MRSLSRAVFLLLLASTPVLASKPDEAALQALWADQQKDSQNHVAQAQAAAAFEQQFPSSPLVTIARGLEAWDLLESGNLEAARLLLEKMASANSDPVASIGAEMARRWLTRLDREQVVTALQKVYGQDLEYPDALSAVTELPPAARPVMTDRWGTPWDYTPAAFKTLQTGDRQTFTLQSPKLGTTSDLKDALARPYGSGFTFTPSKVMPSIGGKVVIVFKSPDGKSDSLSEGAAANDLAFAYLGDDILILSSGDYWSLQPRPSS